MDSDSGLDKSVPPGTGSTSCALSNAMLNRPAIAMITMVVRMDSPLVVTLDYEYMNGIPDLPPSRLLYIGQPVLDRGITPRKFCHWHAYSLMGLWFKCRVPRSGGSPGGISRGTRRFLPGQGIPWQGLSNA
jgi:hypothetical protein